MPDIGIFFGSDTGNTENVAKIIYNTLGSSVAHISDIAKCNQKDFEKYNRLILGIPTWYYGELQCDWDDFIPILKKIDFTGKYVALFGCGDQEDYGEYFCDALGIVYDILRTRGACIVGFWPVDGYFFEMSKSIVNEKYFVGLALDEDRQAELTIQRVDMWIKQVLIDMNLN